MQSFDKHVLFRTAAFCAALAGASVSNSLVGIGLTLYFGGLLFAVLDPAQRDTLPKLPAPAPVILAAICIASVYSFLISAYPAESARGLLKYGNAFLGLYAGYECFRTDLQRRWVLGIVMAGAAAAALSGLGQDLWGVDFIRGRHPVPYTDVITRITGPFKHCNDFATFLVPVLLLGIAAGISGVRARKVLRVVLSSIFVAVLTWALTRTMSRAAMAALVAGMIALMLMMPHRRYAAGIMTAGLAAVWFIPSAFSVRLRELFDPHSGLMERVVLLEGTLKMVREAPWFGLGMNTYSQWFPIYNPPDPRYPVLMYAHNSYLQIMAESGAVGLVLLLGLIAVCVFAAFKKLGPDPLGAGAWERPGLIAGVIALLANAVFESLLQSTQLRIWFWALLGMAAADHLSTRTADPNPGPCRSRRDLRS